MTQEEQVRSWIAYYLTKLENYETTIEMMSRQLQMMENEIAQGLRPHQNWQYLGIRTVVAMCTNQHVYQVVPILIQPE